MPLPPALVAKLDARCTILGIDQGVTAGMSPICRAMVGSTIEGIAKMMRLAPETCYRVMLQQQMTKALAGIDAQRPSDQQPTMPPKDRAKLLMLRRPLPVDADEDRVRNYLVGVALGLGVEELAERVAATGSAELIVRFLRHSPHCDRRERVRDMLRVAEVMEA